MSEQLEALSKKLIETDELTDDIWEAVHALGPAAEPRLIAILDDAALDDPRGGQSPTTRAADVIGNCLIFAALPALLRALNRTGETALRESVEFAIHQLIEVDAPRVLEALADAEGSARAELACLLADNGVRDPRLTAALVAALSHPGGLAHRCAAALADIGDASAVPALREAFAAAPEDDLCALDMALSVEKLGGTLDAPLLEKRERMRERRREGWRRVAGEGRKGSEVRRVAARTQPKVGRNEPCRCGSGKKYKKCHLGEDEGVEGAAS